MAVPPLQRAAVVSKLRAAGCVFAEEEAQLLVDSAKTPGELATMVERRAAGVPLEHVVGWADFCGLRVAVDPGVFVPRRRTELLVRRAVAVAAPGAIVVDLACGSGAVGMAVAALVGSVALYAVDIEPAAVDCARRNLGASDGKVYAGDLYEALPVRLRGKVDVLVANVPYVPTGAVDLLPREARVHEPRVALDGGPDGLDVLRRVAEAAPYWLAEGGHLLVETSADQVDAAIDTLVTAGLTTTVASDPALAATVVVGRRIVAPTDTQPSRAPRR
jgi:release factor glutamine methyltransferase